LNLNLVYRQGSWIYTTWRDVKVGDIVRVIDQEFFPADLVLISSGFAFKKNTTELLYCSIL